MGNIFAAVVQRVVGVYEVEDPDDDEGPHVGNVLSNEYDPDLLAHARSCQPSEGINARKETH